MSFKDRIEIGTAAEQAFEKLCDSRDWVCTKQPIGHGSDYLVQPKSNTKLAIQIKNAKLPYAEGFSTVLCEQASCAAMIGIEEAHRKQQTDQVPFILWWFGSMDFRGNLPTNLKTVDTRTRLELQRNPEGSRTAMYMIDKSSLYHFPGMTWKAYQIWQKTINWG